MFVLTTVTRDCKNGDLYVSVDDNAYLTKEAASAALRARYEDFLKSKDIVDKYLARPDFYRLNISLENDCNGTSSDAYLQLTFSLKHIEFSGGYNFANLFSAEYRKDTGWFVVSGEGEVLMGTKK